jgi:hypothetical protein
MKIRLVSAGSANSNKKEKQKKDDSETVGD